MTNEMLSKLVGNAVQKAFAENQEVISEKLVENIPEGVNIDTETSEMIVKAMILPSQMSVQLVIKMLESAGVIALPPDETPLMWLLDEEEI